MKNHEIKQKDLIWSWTQFLLSHCYLPFAFCSSSFTFLRIQISAYGWHFTSDGNWSIGRLWIQLLQQLCRCHWVRGLQCWESAQAILYSETAFSSSSFLIDNSITDILWNYWERITDRRKKKRLTHMVHVHPHSKDQACEMKGRCNNTVFNLHCLQVRDLSL